MQAVDQLFAWLYMLLTPLAALYFIAVISLALRNQPGTWTNLAQWSIQMGRCSGKALLIVTGVTIGFAGVFHLIGLPKTALWIVISTVFFAVAHFACFLTRIKMSQMKLVSECF